MKLLRMFLISLLVSLLAGVVLGTLIRKRMEAPTRYIGSAPGALPHDVGYARPPVLETRQHEQQIG